MSLRHVLLCSNESATISAVSLAFQSNGKLAPGDIVRDLGELTSRLQNAESPAVLVDVDGDPLRTLSVIEPLVRRHAKIRFVVLANSLSNDLLLEAMQVGVRHVLLKESIPSDLNGVLSRICLPAEHSESGSVVTVLSAGGGCGATTVAVNLAKELNSLAPKETSEPSLVMDLDSNYGSVAAYYSLDGEYGVFDLLSRSDPLDAQLIRTTSVALSEKIHVLMSTSLARLGDPTVLESERIGEAVEACRSAYRWTVIDAPRVSIPVAAELSRRSNATLLLLQLTVKDIRVARKMLGQLAAHGVEPATIRVLFNRYTKRGQLIDLADARRALGASETWSVGTLSNDYKAVSKAVNLGKPLADVSPRSDFIRDLRKVATTLTQPVNAVAGILARK
jgi:pilus assembly protein CpaE